MKSIVQTGQEAVDVRETDEPSPGSGEVLVRVNTAGLCGSDAHAYRYENGYEWIPIPRIMGHEYSGEVVEVAPDVTQFEVGDRVVEEPIHECGACFQCKNGQPNVCQHFSITGMHRDGAYAEYTVVGERHLHAIPDELPLDLAALTEPLSIATRAVFERSTTTPGEHVLVEGPGPIGTLTAIVADALGANVLVSGLAKDAVYRLPLLSDLEIDTVDASGADLAAVVEDRTDDVGMSVVFDTTGHGSGVEMAVDHVRKGGQIVVVGLPGQPSELFMTPLVRGEVELNTSYGSTWRNFEQALRLLEAHQKTFETVPDDSFSIDEPEAAFEAFLAAETCKPVFTFAH